MKPILLSSFLFCTPLLRCQLEIKHHGNGSCPGDPVLLVAVGGDGNYTWMTSDMPGEIISTSNHIEVAPEATITYMVHDSADTVFFTVQIDPQSTLCLCQYYIPNTFRPDGDVFNEVFTPIINCDHIGLHMTIYNREQGIVYDSHELYQSWDGRDYRTGVALKDDVYIYQVSFMRPDGQVISLLGFVLLCR